MKGEPKNHFQQLRFKCSWYFSTKLVIKRIKQRQQVIRFIKCSLCQIYNIFLMQKQNYRNFTDEKTDEQLTVGVPINMPSSQNPGPYFQQPQSENPYIPANQPQGVQPHYNNSFNPMANQPAVLVMNNQRVAVPQIIDYSQPINIKCPCCSLQVTTIVNNQPGNSTYLWAGVLGCCISPCCFCVPFLSDRCMDKNHFCPSCGFNIMRKHRGFLEWC